MPTLPGNTSPSPPQPQEAEVSGLTVTDVVVMKGCMKTKLSLDLQSGESSNLPLLVVRMQSGGSTDATHPRGAISPPEARPRLNQATFPPPIEKPEHQYISTKRSTQSTSRNWLTQPT
jgi:hypothetical protein